jgi:hypothetical protein
MLASEDFIFRGWSEDIEEKSRLIFSFEQSKLAFQYGLEGRL